MATVFERFESADTLSKDKGQGGDSKLLYGILDCADEATAAAAVRAVAPLAISAGTEILVRQSVGTKPVGLDYWEAEVAYGPESDDDSQQPREPGTWKFDFDTTGATQKITTAPLVSRHGSSSFGEAPDLQGAIGYDDQSKQVKGLEVPIPNGKFSITQYFEARQVTPNLMRTYMRATPRINTDTWLGFAPGEVLYHGSRGSGDIPTLAGQRVQPIGIQHFFEASENITGLDIEGIDQNGKYGTGAFDANGNPLSGPTASLDKKGWEYVWTWFKRRLDEDESRVVPRPAFAYVHAPFANKRMSFAEFFGFGAGS